MSVQTKRCSRCAVTKPLEEFSRYRAKPDGHTADCKNCRNARYNAWRAGNRELYLAALKRYRESHLEERLALGRKWTEENRERHLATSREWKRRNKSKQRAYCAARKRYMRRATPPWADMKVITAFYRAKPEGMQVDHIVPLRSKFVCGLHCEANLRYLPAAENLSKRNFSWPDMAEVENVD